MLCKNFFVYTFLKIIMGVRNLSKVSKFGEIEDTEPGKTVRGVLGGENWFYLVVDVDMEPLTEPELEKYLEDNGYTVRTVHRADNLQRMDDPSQRPGKYHKAYDRAVRSYGQSSISYDEHFFLVDL